MFVGKGLIHLSQIASLEIDKDCVRWEKFLVLEFLYEPYALDIALVIVRDIPGEFPGLGEKALTNVAVDSLLGNLASSRKLADFH